MSSFIGETTRMLFRFTGERIDPRFLRALVVVQLALVILVVPWVIWFDTLNPVGVLRDGLASGIESKSDLLLLISSLMGLAAAAAVAIALFAAQVARRPRMTQRSHIVEQQSLPLPEGAPQHEREPWR